MMVYAVLVSALFAMGAAIAHRLIRSSLPGTRFIWAAAMAAALLMIATTPARLRAPVEEPAVEVAPPSAAATLSELPMSVAARAAVRLPAWGSSALSAFWVGSALTALLVLAASYRRHRRRIALAQLSVLDGTRVRITESLGPAVVGVWRPDIVVPRWLLGRAREEQSMVVRHERSHVEVGDPALLLAGCVAAALMPWNPVCWYMLARLRLAIELDCDRRVLRTGAPARAYGALLIELTSAAPAARIGAPAFACRHSQLERRLLAMTDRPLSHTRTRLLAAAGVAVLAVLGACQADLPTAAEVESMDVAALEKEVAVIPGLKLASENAIYFLDGLLVDRSTVMALDGSLITNLEVQRNEDAPKILVSTRQSGGERQAFTREQAAAAETRTTLERAAGDGNSGSPKVMTSGVLTILRPKSNSGETEVPYPAMIIDGVMVERTKLQGIRPSDIEKVEVVKGAAALAQYGEKAANGVILVTTWAAAKKP